MIFFSHIGDAERNVGLAIGAILLIAGRGLGAVALLCYWVII